RGDTARAIQLLAASNHAPGRADRAAAGEALRRLTQRDTLGALLTLRPAVRRAALDPVLHAIAADCLMGRPESMGDGEVEAFAARVLDPGSPFAWRRWGLALWRQSRQRESIAALERYFALRPEARSDDPVAARALALARRMLPGGDLQQRALRKEYVR